MTQTIPIAKLWQRTSARGNTYFTGFLGQARVLLMENRERKDDKDATHVLLIAENKPQEPNR